MIEVLDLFSAAAGGWSLGLHRAGFTTVAACEVLAWRRALYAQNFPHVRLYDDVRTLTAERLFADLGRLPTIVVGSPPCQDISSANTKGRGVEGERSRLYFEAVRLIGEIRPRWYAIENSANLRTRGADAVCAALEALGYACWPLVVRAGDIGANHERPRCWLVGCDIDRIGDADDAHHWLLAAQRGLRGGADAVDQGGDAADVHRDPLRIAVLPGAAGAQASVAGDAPAPHAAGEGHEGWSTLRSGREARDQHEGSDAPAGAGAVGGGDAANADQAGQAHGCVEPGLRSPEIPDHGCGAGRRADGASVGQNGPMPA